MTTPSETDKQLTTAQAIGLFARELATYEEITSAAIHDLVVVAGEALVNGRGELAVNRNV